MNETKTKDENSGPNKVIITAPIVTTDGSFGTAEAPAMKEFYVERSIQNYYIKFCESSVSPVELEQALANSTGFIKALRLEVEFKEGDWDICNDDDIGLGRTGSYVIVHKIL